MLEGLKGDEATSKLLFLRPREQYSYLGGAQVRP